MLLERGIDVSYETVRRWMAKFWPQIARNLRRCQRRPGDIWHLDEVVVKISGKTFWLWRAVDQGGVVLDEILQSRRDKRPPKRFLRKLMKRAGSVPKRIITDKLRSYGAAKRKLLPDLDHRSHEGLNNRADNSHLPFRKRERVMHGSSLARWPATLRVHPFSRPQLFLRSSSPTRRPDHSLPPDGSSPHVESSSQHRLRPSFTALPANPSVNVTTPQRRCSPAEALPRGSVQAVANRLHIAI